MNANGTTNGTAPPEKPPPLTPQEMKEKWQHLRIANKLKREEMEASLLESYGYGDFGTGGFNSGSSSAEQMFLARGQSAGIWIPIAQPSDRKGGAKWPLWRDDFERHKIMQASRLLCGTNDFAKALLRNRCNYVIAKGFNYDCAPKSDEIWQEDPDLDPVANEAARKKAAQEKKFVDQLCKVTKSCIDDFCERNSWNTCAESDDEDEDGAVDAASNTKEKESFWRVDRDGETLLRLFKNEESGKIEVRFVGPEMIWGIPAGQTQADGWYFGIKHRVSEDGQLDLEKVVAYYIRPRDVGVGQSMTQGERDSLGGEIVPASEILHIKDPWEDAEVSRGTPAFSFDTHDALVRASKLQRNMSISSAVRAARAEVWKHATASAGDIQRLQQGPGTRQVETGFGSTRTEKPVFPGSTSYVDKGLEPVPYSTNTNIQDHSLAKDGDLRQAVAGFCAPEMMAGSTNDANYNTAREAGTPFVTAAEAEQEHYKTAFLRLMWRVVRFAVKCQKLPAEVLKLVKINAEGSEVHRDNEGEKANARKINMELKVTSRQIECAALGNDPKKVAADIKEDEKEFPPQRTPGAPGQPGAPQPGKPGQPQDKFPGVPKQNLRESLDADAGWVNIPAEVLALLEAE